MNIEQAKNLIIEIFEKRSDIPLALVGGSGLGKTTVAKEIANGLGLPFVYLPVRTDDVLGFNLPDSSNNFVRFVPSERLHKAMTEPCLLYIDELNRADRYARAAVMELTGERTVAGRALHPECRILLTMNPENKEHDVTEIDTANKSRMVPIPVEHSPQASIAWAQDNNCQGMVSFFAKYPQAFKEEVAWKFQANDRFIYRLDLIRQCIKNCKDEYNELTTFCLGERAGPMLISGKNKIKVDSFSGQFTDILKVFK